MLDQLAILFSTIMLVIVIVRAVKMDRAQPWYEPLQKPDAKAAGAKTGPGVRPPPASPR